jgi:tetraacyldisaccharide 4'-kinase
MSDCDVVLSDDGLQHLRMGRTREVVIIDASRMFGNGLCIPAGPLRETRSKLEQADLVVYNQTAMVSETDDAAFSMQPGEAVNLVSGERCSVQDFIGRHVHVVAGIGNPWRLFEQMGQMGIEVTPHVFPDHHSYSMDDFSSFAGQTVLMTHKDAVKCSRLVQQGAGDHGAGSQGDETGNVLRDAWYLTADVSISERLGSEFEKLAMSLRRPDATPKPEVLS